MSTAAEIVTDAIGMLGTLDINEIAPSPTEMTKSLRALNQMIDSWVTQGLTLKDQTRTCVVDGSTALITGLLDPLTGLVDVTALAPGMNVNGSGIPAAARILSIDDIKKQIMLDAATNIAGGAVSLAFKALPFEAKFEQGVAALLALRLAPLMGEDNIPAYVQRLAIDGWHALQGNFMRPGQVVFDQMLIQTSTRRTSVIAP